MRFIETIKIVDGKCLNLDYHCRRAGFEIIIPKIAPEFCVGVVKWKIVYGDGLPIESQLMPYQIPKIKSLAIVDGSKVEYSRKYENRSEIAALMSLRGHCDDILIVKNGMVSDTSFCNIVFENESGLFTPSTPLLKGTKRQKLLDDGVIQECSISINDICKYKKAYLINAMLDIEDNVFIETAFIAGYSLNNYL